MNALLRSLVLAGLVVISATACATTRAEAPRERLVPPLDVPIPPPRVIAPLPVPDPPPIPPVNNISGGAAPAPAKPRPAKPAESSTKPEKPEEKPETPAPPPAPVPQLSIPEAGDTSKLTADTRATIDRTRAALGKIDYGKLSEPGQKNYNDAKLFADQAEAALKASKFLEAKELAEKAERLAKALQGR